MTRSGWIRLTASPLALAALLVSSACATAPAPPPALDPVPAAIPAVHAAPAGPTVQEATEFITNAEKRLLELGIAANHAAWVQSNFITYDTQVIAAAAAERFTAAGVELANDATRFDALDLPYDVRRRIDLLKLALTAPAPRDPEKTRELTQIATRMEARYGEGKYCPPGAAPDKCLNIQDITRIFAESRDPKRLQEVWTGWRTISPPMKNDYARFVQLSNEGARELGYPDTGTFWRMKYDMPPQEFSAELDRLWGQVRPLYESLHCYVRARLSQKYGASVVPPNGPIPAHLLGNIWAQDWSNIYDLVAPPAADPGYDLTRIIEARKLDAVEMTRIGERFFTSLGFDPLPKTFWERSLFTKPRDREVVCHASAWNMDEVDDLRIKMCIEPNAEDFRTIHHELGHNFYQRAYNQLPYLYRQGANDGFHEAIGDTITLSVTPAYLRQIGFISKEPDPSKDVGLLMKDALEGVAFLPFGLLIDQWRWKVFSAEVTPAQYNQAWWDLRLKYQGVAPPVARTENDFDPGAKYHVPANVPYTRYFLARILQYQFHRSLCAAAGYEGPLNRCTIYGNKEAGKRLQDMLALGISRPWPDALEAATGQRQMDATAIVDYYAPLKTWLDQQNRGRQCGW
jgi:peptidyl-dipeptidase A